MAPKVGTDDFYDGRGLIFSVNRSIEFLLHVFSAGSMGAAGLTSRRREPGQAKGAWENLGRLAEPQNLQKPK